MNTLKNQLCIFDHFTFYKKGPRKEAIKGAIIQDVVANYAGGVLPVYNFFGAYCTNKDADFATKAAEVRVALHKAEAYYPVIVTKEGNMLDSVKECINMADDGLVYVLRYHCHNINILDVDVYSIQEYREMQEQALISTTASNMRHISCGFGTAYHPDEDAVDFIVDDKGDIVDVEMRTVPFAIPIELTFHDVSWNVRIIPKLRAEDILREREPEQITEYIFKVDKDNMALATTLNGYTKDLPGYAPRYYEGVVEDMSVHYGFYNYDGNWMEGLSDKKGFSAHYQVTNADAIDECLEYYEVLEQFIKEHPEAEHLWDEDLIDCPCCGKKIKRTATHCPWCWEVFEAPLTYLGEVGYYDKDDATDPDDEENIDWDEAYREKYGFDYSENFSEEDEEE